MKLIPASLWLATALTAAAHAQGNSQKQEPDQVAAERARIEGLADGTPEVFLGADERARRAAEKRVPDALQGEVRALVVNALAKGDLGPVLSLGGLGTEILADIVRETDLDTLLKGRAKSDPIRELYRNDPLGLLEILREELRERPYRFVALARHSHALGNAVEGAWPEHSAAVAAVLDEIIAAEAIDEQIKIELVASAVRGGADPAGATLFLLDRIEQWPESCFFLGDFLAEKAPERAGMLSLATAGVLAGENRAAALLLSEHPDSWVRFNSIEGVDDGQPYSDDIQWHLLRLANDEDPWVAHEALESISALFRDMGVLGHLKLYLTSIDRLGCYHQASAEDVAQALGRALGRAAEEEVPVLKEILQLVFSSEDPLVAKHVKRQIWSAASPCGIRAAALAFSESGGMATTEFKGLMDAARSYVRGAEGETALLDLLLLVPQAYRLEDSHRRLSQISDDRLQDAYVWLAGYDLQRGTDFETAWGHLASWIERADAAARIAADKAVPADARILAAVTRLAGRAPFDEGAAAAQAVLLDAAADPQQRFRLVRLITEISRDPADATLAPTSPWPAALVRLCAAWPVDAEISPAFGFRFGIPEDAALESMAVETALRLLEAGDSTDFLAGGRRQLAAVLRRRPDLMDRGLLKALLELSDVPSEAVAIGLESTDPALRQLVSGTLLANLRRATRGEVDLAAEIARFPEDEVLTALIEVVASKGDTSLHTWMDEQVQRLMRLRSARDRLLLSRRQRPSLEDAVARTLQLLDHAQPEVRVEAIRGLATLGAVEALPALIERVGTGTDEEKVAARETLAYLRERAAAQAKGTGG